MSNGYYVRLAHGAGIPYNLLSVQRESELPEGSKVLETLLPDSEHEFWCGASGESLASVWDNTEDDVYGQLLVE